MDYAIAIIIVIILIFIIIVIKKFNTITYLNKKVEQAESNIDIFLKRRYDMLTNLQEVVKGYAKHEKEISVEIAKIRSKMTIKDKEKTNKKMDESYNKLNMIIENYPKLSASENYKQLQESIVDCEDNLTAARRIYNSNVNDYNVYIGQFPNVFIAKILDYKERDFFDYNEENK